MKQQILEVQNYFVQKIQNREYTLLNSEMQVDGWLRADLDIEDFKFEISCKNEILCTHVTPIQFTREQKELINESLQYLKKDFREKSIQLLKDKIAELESQN